MSREDLGQECHVSAALVKAWENGRRIPQSRDVPRIEQALGIAGGYLKRLRDDLVHTEPVPEYMGRWREIEDAATSLTWFQPLVVPGLLQTSSYAQEIIYNSGREVDDVSQQIDDRIARQAILAPENGLTFVAILDEVVLTRRVGDAKVMREQLVKLLEAALQPNITIQIVKLDAGAYPGLAGGFGIAAMDGHEYVYVDDAFSGDVLEDPTEVAVMKRVWLTLHGHACSAKESIDMIQKAVRQWET